VAVAAAALTGCGTGATAPSTATAPQAPQPANPVPILENIGATPGPGETIGQMDIYGDRYASGTFYGPAGSANV
jgi:hypothetical protein